jgi:hypothetical protein
MEHPSACLASDSLHFPRIYPGGQPLFDSVGRVNTFLVGNKVLSRFLPISVVLLTPAPGLGLIFYILGVYAYHVRPGVRSNSCGN